MTEDEKAQKVMVMLAGVLTCPRCGEVMEEVYGFLWRCRPCDWYTTGPALNLFKRGGAPIND